MDSNVVAAVHRIIRSPTFITIAFFNGGTFTKFPSL